MLLGCEPYLSTEVEQLTSAFIDKIVILDLLLKYICVGLGLSTLKERFCDRSKIYSISLIP